MSDTLFADLVLLYMGRNVVTLKGDFEGHPFRGNQYGTGSGGAELSEHPHEFVGAGDIEPLNKVTDRGKFEKLSEDMKANGWTGRPVLAHDSPNGLQAVTGSHRIFAAREAGIDVPVSVMKFEGADYEDISDFLEAKGDDDRYLAAKRGKFVQNGFITQDQFDLLKQEYDESE